MCGESRKHGFEAEGEKVTSRSTVTVKPEVWLKAEGVSFEFNLNALLARSCIYARKIKI